MYTSKQWREMTQKPIKPKKTEWKDKEIFMLAILWTSNKNLSLRSFSDLVSKYINRTPSAIKYKIIELKENDKLLVE